MANRGFVFQQCFAGPKAAKQERYPDRRYPGGIHRSNEWAIMAAQLANPIAGIQTGTVT